MISLRQTLVLQPLTQSSKKAGIASGSCLMDMKSIGTLSRSDFVGVTPVVLVSVDALDIRSMVLLAAVAFGEFPDFVTS